MTQCKHRWVLVEDEEDSNIWWIQCRDCGKDTNDSDVNSVLDEYYANQERRCETCRHWDDWSEGGEEWVYCDMTGCHWQASEYCSRWEAIIPRVTSTEAEFDAESANSTTKIT